MSTNISVPRRCEFCGSLFMAKTTVTRFCSHSCNSKNHKRKVKEEKIKASKVETIERTVEIKKQSVTKEFLKVKDVADLLECTPEAVYAMIHSGRLKATNLGIRKFRILRANLLAIFEQPNTLQPLP
ncbi:helix-turn-helix domain-containing protein [Pedobacter roseus]|uniref:Helix-turn-helix domain-containing protein n=1 Tax=Pedobacter roseus TaxID=336820 RepID=A0A7G9QNF1_9SPHI|nr:helix-turn-helix domain-containing protein [Pedobacter roseus]QNN44876.1 helix-turn-helix domain-containing protein [Pedobacter roseus]